MLSGGILQVTGGPNRLAGSRIVAMQVQPAAARARRVSATRPLTIDGRRIRAVLTRAFASERVLPVSIVMLILFTSVLSFAPLGAQAVGGTNGDGNAPRIAIGGDPGRAGVLGDADPVPAATGQGGQDQDLRAAPGGLLADGTLLKPVAVDTAVADGKALVVTYTVQSGDTLSGIASRYNVNFSTIWWANNLTSKDTLSVGQVLRIPTVNGIVTTVTEGDTIEGLAGKYGIDPGQIISVNSLQDPNLVIGQTLVLPGAQGGALPTSAPKPVVNSSGIVRTTAPTTYSGGTFAWPVSGGGNYISQYFRSGHYGLDIAADYGTTVVAGGAGSVIFSGWLSNGGGYQVWISHGSNLYTTYNHMSALTVASGQGVGRGQQVGRVGMTGLATGPHLHFEVWIGSVWNGGYRVNPLGYL